MHGLAESGGEEHAGTGPRGATRPTDGSPSATLYDLGPEAVTLVVLAASRRIAGQLTQGVLMSVYRTLKLRGLDPTRTIAEALRTYVRTTNSHPSQTLPLQKTELLRRIKRTRRAFPLHLGRHV